MDKKIENVFSIVEKEILERFPGVNVEIEHDKETGEYFISIDNSEIYYSDSFQLLITELSFKVIWPAHISGVFFTYEKQHVIENWSIDFSQGLSNEIYYENNPVSFVQTNNKIASIAEISKAA